MNTSKPFFLKYLPYILALYLSIIVISYFFFDQKIALYFHDMSLSHSKLLSLGSELISPECSLVVMPVLFYLFRIVRKKEKLGNKILLIILAVACGNFIASILKIGLGRARPELYFLYQDYGFKFIGMSNLWLSFPSGHAMTMGAFAGAFSCFVPRLSFLFNVLALLFSFIRVIQTKHFLSDIFAGVLVGMLVAQWLYIQMNKAQYRM